MCAETQDARRKERGNGKRRKMYNSARSESVPQYETTRLGGLFNCGIMQIMVPFMLVFVGFQFSAIRIVCMHRRASRIPKVNERCWVLAPCSTRFLASSTSSPPSRTCPSNDR